MIRVVQTDSAYERILDRSTGALTEAINSIARAYVAGRDRSAAILRLANVIGKNVFLSELLGRESTAQVARHITKAPASFEDSPSSVVTSIPFTEAVEDIVARTPEVAPFATPGAVAQIVKRGGFTLARAADQLIVERVQKAIASFVELGKSTTDAAAIISEIGDWSRAYSETTYRTNIARAFSGGRMAQVDQPGVREAIPAFRYSAINDDSVRENHWAANGLVAPVGHAVWGSFKPPLGFNCRCGLDFVDVYDYEYMKKKGVLRGGVFYPKNFSKAGPDPGFVVS